MVKVHGRWWCSIIGWLIGANVSSLATHHPQLVTHCISPEESLLTNSVITSQPNEAD